MITPNKAKAIIKAALEANNLPFDKLTAKTVDFTDLARAKPLFVTIHGWKPNPIFSTLQKIAKDNGFKLDVK